jgi:hypothetical protein
LSAIDIVFSGDVAFSVEASLFACANMRGAQHTSAITIVIIPAAPMIAAERFAISNASKFAIFK